MCIYKHTKQYVWNNHIWEFKPQRASISGTQSKNTWGHLTTYFSLQIPINILCNAIPYKQYMIWFHKSNANFSYLTTYKKNVWRLHCKNSNWYKCIFSTFFWFANQNCIDRIPQAYLWFWHSYHIQLQLWKFIIFSCQHATRICKDDCGLSVTKSCHSLW